jgi:transmembrane sensor
MPNQRLQYLFDLYTQGNCTPEEKRELYALALASKNEADVQEMLDKYWNEQTIEFRMPEEKAEGIVQSIMGNETKVVPRIHRIHFQRSRWWAAAAILILFATGSYFLFFNNKNIKQNEIVNIEPGKDVKAPSSNWAMITLPDGRTVYLDSAANGELVQQGNIKLVKLANGQIAYQTANGEIIKELQYNTLSNPRGSKVIDMQLSDGSHVWLNAGSSVTYPVAFIGSERKVTVTGEAYFEVVHNESMPFKVSKGEMEISVLGTHFNVNAYNDEQEIKVTLLEGSVKVSKGETNSLLKPGQQAIITSSIKVVNDIDVDEVMAWKNGRFQFGGAGIEEVMRQIARWYDVEVVYEVKPKEVHFGGGISRNVEVSKVFKMLETTEAVHFRIEGKKVFVIR